MAELYTVWHKQHKQMECDGTSPLRRHQLCDRPTSDRRRRDLSEQNTAARSLPICSKNSNLNQAVPARVKGCAHLFFAFTSARESSNKRQMPMCPFVAEKNSAVRPPLLQSKQSQVANARATMAVSAYIPVVGVHVSAAAYQQMRDACVPEFSRPVQERPVVPGAAAFRIFSKREGRRVRGGGGGGGAAI